MNILVDRPKALKIIEMWMEKKFGRVEPHKSESYHITWFIDPDGLILAELTGWGELHVSPKLFMEVESIFGLGDRTAELMGIFEMYFEKKFDCYIERVHCSWGANLFGVGDNINNL